MEKGELYGILKILKPGLDPETIWKFLSTDLNFEN